MTIFVTGIAGFLGSHLARFWSAAGHRVTGSSRKPGSGFMQFQLGEPFPVEALKDCDLIVHAAHDFQNEPANLDGARAAFAAAESAGVRRQIYISSYSARPNATAVYGRTKFQVEQWFLSKGESIVRPGLVAGDGGLFARSVERILSSPVLPLLDGGHYRIPIVGVPDFVAAMDRIALLPADAYNLFTPESITMSDLAREVNDCAGHRALPVPVPSTLVLAGLRWLPKLGIRLAWNADSVQSLQQSQDTLHTSDLPDLLPAYDTAQQAIRKAVRSMQSHR